MTNPNYQESHTENDTQWRGSFDAITGDPYIHSVEIHLGEAETAVLHSLYRCARAINNEPLHELDADPDDEGIDREHEHWENLVKTASTLVQSLEEYYIGKSFHLKPREGVDDVKYRFIANIIGIDISQEAIIIHYQPNGDPKSVDVSRLGIDYDLDS